VVGEIGWIFQLKRKLRREKQKDQPDLAVVKKIRSEEWGVWILTTIAFLYLLSVSTTLR